MQYILTEKELQEKINKMRKEIKIAVILFGIMIGLFFGFLIGLKAYEYQNHKQIKQLEIDKQKLAQRKVAFIRKLRNGN